MPWIRKRDQQQTPQQPVSISDINNSAVAVGSANYVVQGSSVQAAPLDDALRALRALVQEKAGSQAPDALSQVDVLEVAAKADPPDLPAIARVRGWFTRNLPALLPGVLEVIAHPTLDGAAKAAAEIAQNRAAYRPEDAG